MLRIMTPDQAEAIRLLTRGFPDEEAIEEQVREIIRRVRQEGQPALLEYTARFDGARLNEHNFSVSAAEISLAYHKVAADFVPALRRAQANIENYHRKQLRQSWVDTAENGTILGQMIRPLAKVGIYVPGGTASYPSSVLMNAIPAKVAGVPRIVMATPPQPDGSVNPYTLVAAAEAGVTEIYKMGGAQAVAALAYGTATVPQVDKITGPGNIYVTLAKKMVYGQVDIDMLAGPSEIVIIADDTANPAYVAADLLSQAEHDPRASAILLTWSRTLAEQVRDEVTRQLAQLPRNEIASRALADYGAALLTTDLEEAISLANQLAPEHLEIMVTEPFRLLGQIKNAGAIFLGPHSPEPVGDYYAGPNHVLPTMGTARFYAPLNVDTFQNKSSLIAYSPAGLQEAAADIITLANLEGLEAHANAIKVRIADRKPAIEGE